MSRIFLPRTVRVCLATGLVLTSITLPTWAQPAKAPEPAVAPKTPPAAKTSSDKVATPPAAVPPAGAAASPAAPAPPPATAPPSSSEEPTKPASEPSAPSSTGTSAEGTTEVGPAPARPTAEQIQSAKEAFAAGEAAFAAANYAEAEAKFRQAGSLIPTPHAEYWIAASMDKQAKPPKEVFAAFELFLNHPAREHVGQELLNAALSRAAEIKATLPASIIIETTPPGAQLKVDGVVVPGKTPIEVEMDRGTHRLELSLPGYETSVVELDAEAGVRVRAPVELVKAKVAPPTVTAPTAEERKRNPVPGIVTLSLGGAGLISGTIFGILALDSKSQYDKRPTAEKADDAERNALIADMSFGIALTLGITGIVLLTTDDDGVNPSVTTAKVQKPTVHFAPFASASSGGASLFGTF
jgi:PEGA domain